MTDGGWTKVRTKSKETRPPPSNPGIEQGDLKRPYEVNAMKVIDCPQTSDREHGYMCDRESKNKLKQRLNWEIEYIN